MNTGRRNNRSRLLGIAWLVIGLILVVAGNAGGWVFLIIGLVYLASSTERGVLWIAENPKLARGILVGLTVFLILLVAVLVLTNYAPFR